MGLLDSLLSVFGDEQEGDSEVTHRRHLGETTVTVTGTVPVEGIGTVVTAKVENGVVETGDRLELDKDKTATIESMQRNHNETERAEGGDRVGMELNGVEPSEIPERTRATVSDGS